MTTPANEPTTTAPSTSVTYPATGTNPPAQPATGTADGFPSNTPVEQMTPAQQVAYWKHHARKHEERAKAAPAADELERLRASEARLAELENANKSEAQRLQDERDAATATAKSQVAQIVRLQAAIDGGLPGDLLQFVTADTKAGAEEQVRLLLERLKPAGSNGTSAPSLDQGARRTARQSGREAGLEEARKRFGAPAAQ